VAEPRRGHPKPLGRTDKEVSDAMLDRSRKSPASAAAALLGRRGGLRGGKARAASLSARERSEIARHAARARWAVSATERLDPAGAPGRDAARTRRRILAAAVREMSAHGPSGARLARIARRAHVHPKTIYAAFGSREGLIREVFAANARGLRAVGGASPTDLSEALAFWQRFLLERPGGMRAMLWEALDPPAGRLPGADERRSLWRAGVDGLEEMQRLGRIRPGLDPRYLQLALVSLTLMPAALPQMTQLVTGLSPSDPRFREGQETFLRALGRLLEPRP
jgi:TetR/AcrR family transcriptional regulator